MNKATGFCIVKRSTRCLDMRWTSNNRLFVTSTKKCLGTQGKTVGSEVSTFDCDDRNDLQKWECRNETLLALKGQNLYVEVRADDTIALSRTVGPNNQLTITGTSSGACSRTHRGRVRKPLIEPNGAGENAAFWTENSPLHFTYCLEAVASCKRARSLKCMQAQFLFDLCQRRHALLDRGAVILDWLDRENAFQHSYKLSADVMHAEFIL